MKKVIRNCVWETNSSMSHSLVIMPQDQYKKWKEENLYYYEMYYWNPFRELPVAEQPVNGTLYTQEEVLEFLRKIDCEYNPEEWDGDVDEFIRESDDDFKGYEQWHESDWEEYGGTTYTTPGGEVLELEWKCGRDG